MERVYFGRPFPCNADGTIAFSGPKEDKGTTELWVVLLKKAWAKRFGCYYDIEAGFTNECLTDLTGAPCDVVNSSDPELWDKVYAATSSSLQGLEALRKGRTWSKVWDWWGCTPTLSSTLRLWTHLAAR